MSRIKKFLAGKPILGEKSTGNKQFLALFTSILLIAEIGAVAGATSNKETSGDISTVKFSPAHILAKSSCSNTFYPELCYSAIADSLDGNKRVKSAKDIILLSVNVTITAAQRNYVAIEKLLGAPKSNLTERQKEALHDCLETIDETLDELHATVRDLEEYPFKKSLREHADDLKTLLSAAITNQETCLDGYSYEKTANKHAREVLAGGQVLRLEKLCSNSLAMLTNMTHTDIENERKLSGRKLSSAESGGGWPKWLSAGDRRLLQSSSVTPDVVVAADGSGDFRTVTAAVAAAPERSNRRYVIRIKAGVYRENVEVTKRKTNIMFMGDGRSNTIITGSRNFIDGSTTFHSATVAVVGERFLARDITFQNTAGPAKHQAVALRVGSDLSAFYRCDMLAYQDTLYVHSNRQFFVQCLISGTVDFIFGNAAAVFQDCDIHARRPGSGQRNMVTAQGRTDPNQNTGIVIQRCRIGATSDLRSVQGNFPTYLGRPWKEYSRTVVMQSSITDVVHPAGWHEWNGNFALNTLYYGEYQNTGAGAATSGRVGWRGFRVITSATEAQDFTAGRFIAAGSWLSSTGFPFSAGL
ncbi:Pectinesterase [Handroanthus impetiginosus]|uniref:Pectinesterase n=1 Tax=Handroanthus impetiginosus TaxID=429701 RepID=A0A2G9H8A3_9LAMI|nr:Pectinesterase [Handroanthus impetiginosus]